MSPILFEGQWVGSSSEGRHSMEAIMSKKSFVRDAPPIRNPSIPGFSARERLFLNVTEPIPSMAHRTHEMKKNTSVNDSDRIGYL